MDITYIKATTSGGGSLSTAKLMKTGQTTSYRTGDDGDLQEGRDVDFFTLAENNVFGTTDRFTDELGTQVYANDIAIDWSTYDGSTVLGWKATFIGGNITWEDAIDNALLTSISTFTSGWRLPNVQELSSIINYEVSYPLNYNPFNNNSAVYLWTSTTRANSTTRAYAFYNGGFSMTTTTKSTSTNMRYMPCRTFTVTGTTLS